LENEKHPRTLFQALPNTGVVLYDPELSVFLIEGGEIIKKVSTGKNHLGLPVAEFMTRLVGELPKRKLFLFKDVFKGKAHSYQQNSGEECFLVNLVPLRNIDNEIYAGMAIIQDIAQQVQDAENLNHLANQLRMLNHIGQVVVSIRNIQTIYKEVLTRIREIVDAQVVFILLEKNGQLSIEAQDEHFRIDLKDQGMPVTEGIGGEVWRNQKSMLLFGEECLAKVYKPLAHSLGFTPLTYLAVPITWRNQKYGVFVALHSEEDKFTHEDLKLVENVAAWTAIALNNALQLQQLERLLAEKETTSKLLEEILSASLTLESVLQHVVDAGNNIVPSVDWAAIHLFDEQDNRLRLEAVAGISVPPEDYTLDYGQGIAGRVLESGHLINVADVSQDARVVGFPRTSHAHSLLVAPIKNQDSMVIGTITLQSPNVGHFAEEDENLLMLLAHQAGLAIENARLYETAEYRRQVANNQRELMRRLTRQVVVAQEEERERIARELHDEAGQTLTALKISLEMLGNSLPSEMQEARLALKDAADQTGATMVNLRSIAHNLRPPALDRLGLNLALAGLCQQFEAMTHIQVIYEGIELPRLTSSFEITLYRFVQEALTNIAKHAEATEVRVWLDLQTSVLQIHVQDNGKGMKYNPLALESESQEGMGLASMEERLNIIDGKLEVQSELAKGTHLCASVALHLREEPT
jgi:signal transduction histidine kinase